MAQTKSRRVEEVAAHSARRFAGGKTLPPVLRRLLLPGNREPLAVFVLTRFLFVLLTYLGVVLFTAPSFAAPHPSLLHTLIPAWDRWDTAWYIEIARRGYAWRKTVGTSPTAFFPLYPLLIRSSVFLTHRSYLVCSLVISNLAFLAALIYFWRLAAAETDRAVATRAILYVAVFPTAFFFFAGYTESLFLFLTVASFYYMRRREWLLAGLFAAFASATRVTGVLLLLPLAYEYGRTRNFSLRQLDRGILGLMLAPLGLLFFMLYLGYRLGDPLAFSHNQAAWQKIFTIELWAGPLESVRQILVVQPAASFFEAQNVLNAGLGGLFLVLTVLAARRLPAAYTIYGLAFWLLTFTSPATAGGYPVPFVSMARYVLSLFPIFIYLGMLGRRQAFHDVCLVLSTALLGLLTVLFVTGGWIV